MLRHHACHRTPIVAVLVALNITTLLLLCYTKIPGEPGASNEVTKQPGREARLYPVARTTLTVTPVASTTTVVQTVIKQSAPPFKHPGPAFCDVCSPEDVLCTAYGEHNLARSRVYEGANGRFRRLIMDALAGKPTKIGILGGSVTLGHGISNQRDNWTTKFLEAWRTLFPKSETTLVNGAVPAVSSDYYSMCFSEHIDEDVDLVIIELLINDQRTESNAVAYEWLLRGLLELPKNPAIINLHTIGLSFQFITTGGDLHTPVSEYYDVPVVSVRNMLASHIIKHYELDEFYFNKDGNGPADWRHVNAQGHRVMADVLVAYIQRQVCAVEREKAKPTKFVTDGKLPGTEELDTIPRLRLFQKYDRETVTGPIKPTCQSITGTKHPLSPVESRGWRKWVRKDKPYLIAEHPGAKIKFNVVVGVIGRVRITHLRSKTFGLGDVWCWLDNDRQSGNRIVSWWDVDNINAVVVTVVTENASPGKHMLSCEVMLETTDPSGGHEFRLVAVDAS